MYIKYSAIDPLTGERREGSDRVIGKLEWNWGGQVTFNPSSGLYNLDYLNNPVLKTIQGVATTEPMLPFKTPRGAAYPTGYTARETDWRLCGSTDPCDIDPSQCDPCLIYPWRCDPCYNYGDCGGCDGSGYCTP